MDSLRGDFVKIMLGKEAEDPHVCGVCKGGREDEKGGVVARCYCSQCCLWLCQTCSHTHGKYPAFVDHVLQYLDTEQQIASGQKWTCSSHTGQPVELFCTEHEERMCWLCASEGHQSCSGVKSIAQMAQLLRAELTARAQRLRDKESAMSVQTDHTKNEFKAMTMKLQDTFADLQKVLEDRHQEILTQIQTQEKTSLTTLAEAESQQDTLRNTASAIDEVVASATDDALVGMTKSLTSRLEDLESKPDVTANIRTGSLIFDGSKVDHLKSIIGNLGQFKIEDEVQSARPHKLQPGRVSVRGSLSWVRPAEGSVNKAQGPELAKMLRVGHRVKRSAQRISGNADGTAGKMGTVRHIGTKSVVQGLVQVCWDSGCTEWHRMGRENVYELELA